jgi:hypothetical protein
MEPQLREEPAPAGKRHNQVPRRPLVQRAHQIPRLGSHGQARSGHYRRGRRPFATC